MLFAPSLPSRVDANGDRGAEEPELCLAQQLEVSSGQPDSTASAAVEQQKAPDPCVPGAFGTLETVDKPVGVYSDQSWFEALKPDVPESGPQVGGPSSCVAEAKEVPVGVFSDESWFEAMKPDVPKKQPLASSDATDTAEAQSADVFSATWWAQMLQPSLPAVSSAAEQPQLQFPEVVTFGKNATREQMLQPLGWRIRPSEAPKLPKFWTAVADKKVNTDGSQLVASLASVVAEAGVSELVLLTSADETVAPATIVSESALSAGGVCDDFEAGSGVKAGVDQK